MSVVPAPLYFIVEHPPFASAEHVEMLADKRIFGLLGIGTPAGTACDV